MTPTSKCWTIYVRIYEKDGKRTFYTGITRDMDRRQREHREQPSRTVNRYNKAYILKEIKYRKMYIRTDGSNIEKRTNKVKAEREEQRFKRLSRIEKEKAVKKWERWSG